MNYIKGFIASDHRGFELKENLKKKFPLIDLGTFSGADSVDYSDFAKKLVKYVIKEKKPGILICGSGIGMSIASNRYKGIRAALCRIDKDAFFARTHNDANVLVLGSDFTNVNSSIKIVKKFFGTNFSDEVRHKRRIKKLDKLTN